MQYHNVFISIYAFFTTYGVSQPYGEAKLQPLYLSLSRKALIFGLASVASTN